jgi:hypothetical protein
LHNVFCFLPAAHSLLWDAPPKKKPSKFRLLHLERWNSKRRQTRFTQRLQRVATKRTLNRVAWTLDIVCKSGRSKIPGMPAACKLPLANATSSQLSTATTQRMHCIRYGSVSLNRKKTRAHFVTEFGESIRVITVIRGLSN